MTRHTEEKEWLFVIRYWFKWNERYLHHLLTLRESYIVGWAMPTKYLLTRLFTVGSAHPTLIKFHTFLLLSDFRIQTPQRAAS
jgi:hypothetical protein